MMTSLVFAAWTDFRYHSTSGSLWRQTDVQARICARNGPCRQPSGTFLDGRHRFVECSNGGMPRVLELFGPIRAPVVTIACHHHYLSDAVREDSICASPTSSHKPRSMMFPRRCYHRSRAGISLPADQCRTGCPSWSACDPHLRPTVAQGFVENRENSARDPRKASRDRQFGDRPEKLA